ncbi:tRNA glutamyl-Q(34) synthetase GluQRS [Adlercreutzia sp. ZJ138]|uniref:tRNA glutamyl-Q(34) synthetase GluQRS n=1 Tax=Adlercreutzia sp. ZJ138 TaxID=2709405 RepID=UPI0013EDB643|nr:tRNA glutamyl-Q(34) synthetase GluQRS [Adlercreutzia sp. ZJ138]
MGEAAISQEKCRPVVGRFAPSPTGRMHAGNVYAALMAWLIAKSQGGRIALRIEDLDAQRSKSEYVSAIMRDFDALGLTWDTGPLYQSERGEAYRAALDELKRTCRVYPCFCSRADLHAASAPHRGEKLVYAGTCRNLSDGEVAAKRLQKAPAERIEVPAMRIDLIDAIQGPYGQNLATECGDFLVQRADGAFAYQLAVVVDDAEQGVTSVVRGVDLLCSTPQQMFLQRCLGMPSPVYAHIPLLVAEEGRRLSKRDRDAALPELLECYRTPQGVVGHIAYVVGLQSVDEPATPEELLETFDLNRFKGGISDFIQIAWRA